MKHLTFNMTPQEKIKYGQLEDLGGMACHHFGKLIGGKESASGPLHQKCTAQQHSDQSLESQQVYRHLKYGVIMPRVDTANHTVTCCCVNKPPTTNAFVNGNITKILLIYEVEVSFAGNSQIVLEIVILDYLGNYWLTIL